MPGIVAPPDVEVGLITAVRAQFPTRTVGWEVKGPWPCVRLLRVGGTTDEILRVDQALIQAEVWGEPNNVSSTQRVALAALLAQVDAFLVGHIPGLVTVTTVFGRVRTLNRGQWAPDDTTGQQRYFSRHTVAAHAV
jgi:hypothetical protein